MNWIFKKLYFSLGEHWMELSERENDKELKKHYMRISDMYFIKAYPYLGFKTVEDMHAYFEKHKKF